LALVAADFSPREVAFVFAFAFAFVFALVFAFVFAFAFAFVFAFVFELSSRNGPRPQPLSALSS
jgi:hypothetical protein